MIELLHCSSKWSLFEEDSQPHGLSSCLIGRTALYYFTQSKQKGRDHARDFIWSVSTLLY